MKYILIALKVTSLMIRFVKEEQCKLCKGQSIKLTRFYRWTLNLFFVSRKLKRMLIFSVRAQSEYDDLGAMRSGTITPISSNA